MDCFYHNAVPSVAPCRTCRKPVCASCRKDNGDCPGCVLAARIDAAKPNGGMIGGRVGPSNPGYQQQASYQQPGYQQPGFQEPPGFEPQPGFQQAYQQQAPVPPPQPRRAAAVAVRPETRAFVALGYPFWPLALISLLDVKASRFVKRQAWQALGFNFGMYGLGALLGAIASVPLLGLGAWPLMVPFIVPVTIVASIVYAFKVWHGEDVSVPIVSDWVDARLPAGS